MDKQEHVEIRVRGTTQCSALAGSIVASYSSGKRVVLAAIGPLPVTTAVKAVAIANRTLAPRGIMLAVIPAMVTRALRDHRDSPTAEEKPWVVTLLHVHNLLSSSACPVLEPDANEVSHSG